MRSTDQPAIGVAEASFPASRGIPICCLVATLVVLAGSAVPVPAAAAGQTTRIDVALDAVSDEGDEAQVQAATAVKPEAPPLAQPPTWRPVDRDPDPPRRGRILLGIGIVLVVLAVIAAIAKIVAVRRELEARRQRDAQRKDKPPNPSGT